MQSPQNHARGEFAPNTARLIACRAGEMVAGSQKKRLNALFAWVKYDFWRNRWSNGSAHVDAVWPSNYF
jgi:hypothetical protein